MTEAEALNKLFDPSLDGNEDSAMELEGWPFSPKAWMCLQRAGIDTVGKLRLTSIETLKKTPWCGKLTVAAIRDEALQHGIRLKDK